MVKILLKLTNINSKGEKTKTLQAKLNNYVDLKFSSIMPSIFDAATILFQTHPDAGRYASLNQNHAKCSQTSTYVPGRPEN